jgi:5-methylcytosine-specific restriction endonuclease McrA
MNDDLCRICGHRKDLEQHHIVPRRFGGGDSVNNLVTLCGQCHNAVENIYDNRFYDRIGVALRSNNQNEDVHRVDPAHSIDKEFPETARHDDHRGAKHINYERWCLETPFYGVIDRIEKWRSFPEVEDLGLKQKRQYLINTISDNLTDIYKIGRDRENSLGPPLVLEPDEPDENPFIKITNGGERYPDYPNYHFRSWTDHRQRLHCAYCHAVFSGRDHSTAAKHLREEHSVHNPYEQPQPPTANVSYHGDSVLQDQPEVQK